jgi:small subunit ribosomal protein S17
MAETTENRGSRKVRKGVVISRSGNKSIVVQTERRLRHPMYGKVIRQHKKYHAHDEQNAARVGDAVVITECRPLSKMKRWRVVEVASVEGAPKS